MGYNKIVHVPGVYHGPTVSEHRISQVGIGSSKLAHVLGLYCDPNARGPSDRPSFTTVSCIWKVYFSILESPQLEIKIHEFRQDWFSCLRTFFHHDLDVPCSYIPSFHSSTGLPELGLVLGCGSLHLIPSIIG